MTEREHLSSAAGWSRQRLALRLVLLLALLLFPARLLFGVSCPVVKHDPPSEAGKALLAADYAKAESLYRAAVTAHPGDADANVGLVHSLLREQNVLDAAEAVKSALSATSNSAALLTLRGEVELRLGEPWLVEKTVLDSYKLDPCNPRTRLLFARFAEVSSRYATARQQIGLAHQFDPSDPEIRAAWIESLPPAQRIAELEVYNLSAPTGDDQETTREMKADLDRWKKQAGALPRACSLASATTSADIPFIKLIGWAGHTRASGLEMGLNSTTARLQLGAGEGGLTVYRPIAERAGLKRLTPSEPGTFPGAKPTYTAYADSIKIGGLAFHDCTLKVIEASSPDDDGDGLIGIDVFSDFLLTVDYPMRKLQLAPLPVRPQQAAPTPSLHTDRTEDAEIASPLATDRYVAPEMKDYTQIYRVGKSLILPAGLTGALVKDPAAAAVKLFILDLGAPETNVSLGVAMDVSKVHEENQRFGSGKMQVADEITYNFAHMAQKVNGVVTTNTAAVSKMAGMEISGFFGANTFQLLIMHIDYRDGLVKFEYIPNRGYKFE